MKLFLFGSLALFVLGSGPHLLWADSQASDPYGIHPSSQTVKRREAALALGQSQDAAQAAPQLLEALKDKDPMTRTLAIQSLGSLKYAAARPQISQLMLTDPNAEVRETAAAGLRQIGDAQAVDALVKALKDPAMNVRATALMGLARFVDPKSRLPVEAALKDPEAPIRRTALLVLRRLGDPGSVPAVMAALKDSDSQVRAGAAQTLGMLHSTASKPALVSLLKDPDPAIQASAAHSLLFMGDDTGFETAKGLVGSSDVAVRYLSIDALSFSRNPEAETVLSSLLSTAPPDTRRAVQEALTRLQQLRKR